MVIPILKRIKEQYGETHLLKYFKSAPQARQSAPQARQSGSHFSHFSTFRLTWLYYMGTEILLEGTVRVKT
jgi:hypothetical protein